MRTAKNKKSESSQFEQYLPQPDFFRENRIVYLQQHFYFLGNSQFRNVI